VHFTLGVVSLAVASTSAMASTPASASAAAAAPLAWAREWAGLWNYSKSCLVDVCNDAVNIGRIVFDRSAA